METTRKQIAEEKFPATAQVENLVLSISRVAEQMNVHISAFTSTRQTERLSERSYAVIENTLELRGESSDLVNFLTHVKHRTGVDTLEMKNVNLRAEPGSWVLVVQVRMLIE